MNEGTREVNLGVIDLWFITEVLWIKFLRAEYGMGKRIQKNP